MNNIYQSIAIYCVNYHSYDSLRQYFLSIDKAIEALNVSIKVTVVVADNTTPPQPANYEPRFFTLNVLSTGDNKGYFGAVRHAMQRVNPTSFDYSIISNVDVLLSEDFFVALFRYKPMSCTAWIAPAILSQTLHFDFNPQSINRYSLKKMKMLRIMFKFPILLRLKQKLLHMYHDVRVCPTDTIYVGHGSFIILTRTFFEQCGIIDYPIFLYGEEIYLAEVCRQHQLTVEYVPDIKVTDIGRVSTGKIPSCQYCKYNYQAIDYIIKKYYQNVS